jgi:hypothetical protein
MKTDDISIKYHCVSASNLLNCSTSGLFLVHFIQLSDLLTLLTRYVDLHLVVIFAVVIHHRTMLVFDKKPLLEFTI